MDHTLTAAIKSHGRRMVELLLSHDVGVNFATSKHCTPLELAIQTAENASERNKPSADEIVELLRGAGAKALHPEMLDLVGAAHHGNMERLTALLADSSERQRGKAAKTAVNANHQQAVAALVHHGVGAEVAQDLLFSCACAGMVDVMIKLLDAGADVNGSTRHPIVVYASREGQLEAVRLLVDRGADVNRPDCQSETALYVAAQKSRKELVQYLLAQGADPNIRDDGGHTPLQACKENEWRHGDHAKEVQAMLTPLTVLKAEIDALGRQEMRKGTAKGNKVGGWPWWLQEARYPKDGDGVPLTRLLLQLDSYKLQGIKFGDNGFAYLFCSEDDPTILGFVWQCH